MTRRGKRGGAYRSVREAASGDTSQIRQSHRGNMASLYAGYFGRAVPVLTTLTQYDHWAPFASGKALPDLPSSWSPPDVSQLREAWLMAGNA